MGADDFWMEGLGLFDVLQAAECLSQFAGKRFAVDLSIIMNQCLRSDIDKLASTCNPVYKCINMLQNVINVHLGFVRAGIIPVYVFDGIAPLVKNLTKEKRKNTRLQAGADWEQLKQKVTANADDVITGEELKKATAARMKMAHPTASDHAAVLEWMKANSIEVYGSLFEADQQMIQLEKDGIVDGIISEDGDIIILGAQFVLGRRTRRGGQPYYKPYRRDTFMDDTNPFQSKVCQYPEHIYDIALLLGNDYFPRVTGNGPATVLGSRIGDAKDKTSPRDNGMIDQLASAPDAREYINTKGARGKGELNPEQQARYWKAREYMEHAPVIRRCPSTRELSIVPLNSPAGNNNWNKDNYFRNICGLGDVLDNNAMIQDVYYCNVVPLERKPIGDYDGPYCEACVPTAQESCYCTTNGSLFPVLNFQKDPIKIQPTICLVNWLRARGVDAHPTRNTRDWIEETVRECLRVNKGISDSPLTPIAGAFDGFAYIRNRSAGNEYDTWSRNYLPKVQMLEKMTDATVKEKIGIRYDRHSIHERVLRLVQGGNYDVKSIQCRNVETIDSKEQCILLRLDCLSSKKTTIHQLYAVFEDKPGGTFLMDLSVCSCRKGQFFCSHMIGLLHLLHILQSLTISQDIFENTYPISPKLVHKEPLPIELTVLTDQFHRQKSQTKRQRTK